MKDKDEAMQGFKGAINNSSRKKTTSKQENKRKTTKKSTNKTGAKKKTSNNKSHKKPTGKEEKKQLTPEEQAQQEQADNNNMYDGYNDKEEKEEKEKKSPKVDSSQEDKGYTSDDKKIKDEASKTKDDKKRSSIGEASSGRKSKNKSDKKDKDSSKRNSSNEQGDKGRSKSSEGSSSSRGSSGGGGSSSQATQTGAQSQQASQGSNTAKRRDTVKRIFRILAFWKVILITVIIIVILIIVIGFLSFIISGIGIMRDKVLLFADTLWTKVKGLVVGQDVAQVSDENIMDVVEYLDNMGYDVVNFGFLDTLGKNVTVSGNNGSETVQNANGETILERTVNTQTNETEITAVQSKYIKAYLAAENRTYMVANHNKSVASVFSNLLNAIEDFFTGNNQFSSADWGKGLIFIEDFDDQDASEMGLPYSGASDFGNAKNVEVIREEKKMEIELEDFIYRYDLDGWTGKYGTSIEFLLALHIATMAPDFVFQVCTEEEFDTKVHIALYPIEADVEIVYEIGSDIYQQITKNNYADFGLTSEQWNAIEKFNSTPIATYTPFITKVEKHWFKNLDFKDSYEYVENDPSTDTDDEDFTWTYEYVGTGPDDVLSGVNNLWIREVRKGDIRQTAEPLVRDNSKKIKQMLLGSTDASGSENTNEDYKYYIYDGSPLSEKATERPKDYIIKLQKLENGDTNYIMNTKMFTQAFAILENVHSEDAEFILRDLKELFRSIGIEHESLEVQDTLQLVEPLEWPISGYKPIVWDPTYNADSSIVTITHKTESELGFDGGMSVVMPANGEIVEIIEGADDTKGDTVKIRLTGTDRKELEDIYMYISGAKITASVGSTLSRGGTIGTTIEEDIRIIMTNSKNESIYNVDQYIQPEEWEFEEVEETQNSN